MNQGKPQIVRLAVLGSSLVSLLIVTGTVDLTTGPFEVTAVWPGHPRGRVVDVAVAEGRAYLAMTLYRRQSGGCTYKGEVGWLEIVDVSDPAHPKRLGGIGTRGDPTAVKVVGQRAYVTTDGLLQTFDVQDPAHPTRLGVCDTPGADLETWGSRLVVVAGNHLQVIDAPSSGRLGQMARTWVDGDAHNLHATGCWAVVSTTPEALLYDLTTPSAPRFIASLGISAQDAVLAELGGRRYALAAGEMALTTVDVADPMKPSTAGGLDLPGKALAIQVLGDQALVTWAGDETNPGGLAVVDLSDPLTPSLIGEVSLPGELDRLAVAGRHMYVAAGNGGLQVVDLVDLANPAPAHLDELETTGWATHAQAVGGHLYVADRAGGLQILDVSAPDQVTRLGQYQTTGEIRRVLVAGGYAYVLAGIPSENSATPLGVEVLDLTNPAQPMVMGRLGWDGEWKHSTPLGLGMAGGYLLVRAADTLVAVDVSQPSQPHVTGEWHHGIAGKGGFALNGTWAYLGTDGSLLVADVRDPSNVQQWFALDFGHHVRSVHVEDGLAYVGTEDGINGILRVLDLRDPAQPVEIGTVSTAAPAVAIHVHDGRAYVAEVPAGSVDRAESRGWFEIFDVNNPAQPTLLVSQELPGVPEHLERIGDDLWLACGPWGLLRLQPPAEPLVITAEPLDHVVTAGEPIELTVSAFGAGPLAYQWYVGTSGDTAYPIADATGTAVTGTASAGAASYWVRVSQPGGHLDSRTATVTGRVVPAVEFEAVGSWPGYRRGRPDGVAVAGNLLFVASAEAGLMVFDCTNPWQPVRLGGLEIEGFQPTGVRVAGQRACLIGASQLIVVDVSQPSRPTVLGTYTGTQHITDLELAGEHAFILHWDSLEVVNLANPAQPEPLGQLPLDNRSSKFRLAGTLAVIAGYDGIAVVDVSDPAQLVLGGTLPINEIAEGVRVTVAAPYAYVTYSRSNGDTGWQGWLDVVDLNDPFRPFRAGTLRLGADGAEWAIAQGIEVADGYAYVVTPSAVMVCSIANPSTPRLVTHIGVQPGWSSGRPLLVAGKRAFVRDWNGVTIFNLSDPAHPQHGGGVLTAGSANDVQVAGDFAYVADGLWGLETLFVADPQAPLLTDLADVDSGRLQISMNHSVLWAGTRAFSLSAPWNSVQLAANPFAGVTDLDATCTRGYALRDWSCQAWNLNDPSMPARYEDNLTLGDYVLASSPGWVRRSGSGAFVSTGFDTADAAVVRLDFSQPAAPARVGAFEGVAGPFQVSGTRVYVANYGAELAVLDFAVPASPVRTGSVPLGISAVSGSLIQVELAGQHAWVAGSGGIEVFDLSDPDHPVRAGQYQPPRSGDRIERIQVVGDRVYVANGPAGLRILRFSTPLILSVRPGAPGTLLFTWQGAPDVRLELTEQLEAAAWTVVWSGGNGPQTVQVPMTAPTGFYRLVRE